MAIAQTVTVKKITRDGIVRRYDGEGLGKGLEEAEGRGEGEFLLLLLLKHELLRLKRLWRG